MARPKKARAKTKPKPKPRPKATVKPKLKPKPRPKPKPKPKPRPKPKRRRKAEAGQRRYAEAKIGKTSHVFARESEGEPQYTWKELEERAAPLLKRRKKRRWARFVVEMSPSSILRPSDYRKLRGKPAIRTLWHPAEEIVGKAAPIVDTLQRSGAVTPRMKIVVVESRKRPPRKLF